MHRPIFQPPYISVHSNFRQLALWLCNLYHCIGDVIRNKTVPRVLPLVKIYCKTCHEHNLLQSMKTNYHIPLDFRPVTVQSTLKQRIEWSLPEVHRTLYEESINHFLEVMAKHSLFQLL